MGVSLNSGTPISHPKMMIFSRKTHGCLGTTVLGNTHIFRNAKRTIVFFLYGFWGCTRSVGVVGELQHLGPQIEAKYTRGGLFREGTIMVNVPSKPPAFGRTFCCFTFFQASTERQNPFDRSGRVVLQPSVVEQQMHQLRISLPEALRQAILRETHWSHSKRHLVV